MTRLVLNMHHIILTVKIFIHLTCSSQYSSFGGDCVSCAREWYVIVTNLTGKLFIFGQTDIYHLSQTLPEGPAIVKQ